MRLTYAAYTNPGSRKGNEDSYGAIVPDGAGSGEPFFFAVADGLGGHSSGEVASSLAVEHALDAFRSDPDDLAGCFERGQRAILERQAKDDTAKDMKTTLVVLRLVDGRAAWGHIGDSRLYRFVGRHMRQRTLDHSVPQMLVATGEIRERDIRHHEDRNRLIKVMGIEWPGPRYELAEEISLGDNESFLLATDGFWEYVDEKAMERTLRPADSPGRWLEGMLKIAKRNAGNDSRDNYTAIAVFVR